MRKIKVSRRRPAVSYEYRDRQGRILYILARYRPKDFQWLRADLKPWTSRKRRPLLYRLPELMASKPTRMVFVCEGEKDVDRLLAIGLVATCNDNGGGKGKWRRPHCQPLRGRHVVILPDNDATGEEHALDVSRQLVRFTASVRILRLPNLPRKGDVSDWLDAGGTAKALLRMVRETDVWNKVPAYDPPRNDDHRWQLANAVSAIVAFDLTPVEKLLLIILADFANRAPPQATLAAWLGVTERRVRQLIAELRRRKLLTVIRSRRRNSYAVRVAHPLISDLASCGLGPADCG